MCPDIIDNRSRARGLLMGLAMRPCALTAISKVKRDCDGRPTYRIDRRRRMLWWMVLLMTRVVNRPFLVVFPPGVPPATRYALC